jgi:hypothetical protein
LINILNMLLFFNSIFQARKLLTIKNIIILLNLFLSKLKKISIFRQMSPTRNKSILIFYILTFQFINLIVQKFIIRCLIKFQFSNMLKKIKKLLRQRLTNLFHIFRWFRLSNRNRILTWMPRHISRFCQINHHKKNTL